MEPTADGQINCLIEQPVLDEVTALETTLHTKASTPSAKEAGDELVERYGMKLAPTDTVTSLVLSFKPGDRIAPHIEQHKERIVCLSGCYLDEDGEKHEVGDVSDICPGELHSLRVRQLTTLFMQWIPALPYSSVRKMQF